MKRPSLRQLEIALSVLAWLHEDREQDGELRDKISAVRSELWDMAEEAER